MHTLTHSHVFEFDARAYGLFLVYEVLFTTGMVHTGMIHMLANVKPELCELTDSFCIATRHDPFGGIAGAGFSADWRQYF